MNVQSPHKWPCTDKSDVFAMSFSLPPPVGGDCGLMCESVGKADLLSDYFDANQCREAFYLSFTCHPSPRLVTFAFRPGKVRRLLEPDGGTTYWVCFLFFLRILLMFWSRHSVVFRRLVLLGRFPACWRHANVTPFRRVHRPSLLAITDRFP